MQKLNEAFSPEVYNAIKGLYVTDGDVFLPINPAEDLTVESFSIIDNRKKILLSAEDFCWYEDDGSDRDFTSKYLNNSYYSRCNVPEKLDSFLNSLICVRFASEKLEKAKNALDCADEAEPKAALDEAIENFEKATNAIEKLRIAVSALHNAVDVPGEDEDISLIEEADCDLFDELCNAIDVIAEVIDEIS